MSKLEPEGLERYFETLWTNSFFKTGSRSVKVGAVHHTRGVRLKSTTREVNLNLSFSSVLIPTSGSNCSLPTRQSVNHPNTKLRPRHWTNRHSVTKSNNLDMLLILFSMTCTTPRPPLQRTPLPSLLRFTCSHNQTSQLIEYRVRSKDCTISFSDHSGFGQHWSSTTSREIDSCPRTISSRAQEIHYTFFVLRESYYFRW